MARTIGQVLRREIDFALMQETADLVSAASKAGRAIDDLLSRG